MKKCIYCGAELADDSLFCSECGKRIDDVLSTDDKQIQGQCPQCGADVSEGDTFCQECGYNLVNGEENAVNTGYEETGRDVIEEVEESSKSKIIIPFVVGIIALALIGGWYFLGSSNTTEGSKAAVVSDSDSIIVDSDSIVEDISDVHSEAYIKHRLQQICDEIPSTPEKELVNQYFSESFRKLYNAVIEEDKRIESEGNLGFFDFGFWTGGQDGDLESVTVLEVGKTADLAALATVQDLVRFGKNDESKSSKQLNLVFENGDWFIDDFNSYCYRMEEYLNADNGNKSQEELAETNTAIGAFTIEENDDGTDSIR